MYSKLPNYDKVALKLMRVNIKGLNCKRKQNLLFDYIKENRINFISLQEHNLKNGSDLLYIFYEQFHVIINESINLLIAILIDKNYMCTNIQKILKLLQINLESIIIIYIYLMFMPYMAQTFTKSMKIFLKIRFYTI